MTDKLDAEKWAKRCPLCNELPIEGMVGDNDAGYYAIGCCNCNGREGHPFIGVHADSKEEARRIWNERPSQLTAGTLDINLIHRIWEEAKRYCKGEFSDEEVLFEVHFNEGIQFTIEAIKSLGGVK